MVEQGLTKVLQDGIHVDMDRLKKGEVKYALLCSCMRALLTPSVAWELRCELLAKSINALPH